MIAEWNAWGHKRKHSVWTHLSSQISKNLFSYSSSPSSILKKIFASCQAALLTISSSFLILSSDPPHFYFNLAHHLGLVNAHITAFLACLSISCFSAYLSSLGAPAVSDLLISNHSHLSISLWGLAMFPVPSLLLYLSLAE